MDIAAVAEDAVGYVPNRPGDVREVWPGGILTHSPNPMPGTARPAGSGSGRSIAGFATGITRDTMPPWPK
jgi:hypothetical protein